MLKFYRKFRYKYIGSSQRITYFHHLWDIDLCIYIYAYASGKLAEWTDEELEKTAEAIGYGAVK